MSNRIASWFSLALLTVGSVALACQVPVFRYALERWQADTYEVVVLHEAPLSDQHAKAIAALKEKDQETSQTSNFQVRVVDVRQTKDKSLQELWNENDSKQPMLATLFPRDSQDVPDLLVDAVPLNAEVCERVVDSPLRQEIARRVMDGQSAVWIFVPCGDAERDRLALETLQRHVELNQTSLELPEQEEVEEEKELLAQVDIELRLEFSIVTLKRDDPQESFLLKSLLASEPDLEELDEPMAFPVLGRGRVLYALVGKGISETTIGMASRFMIGPCSCQVKNQNPGFDLLMSYDWEGKLGEARLSDPIPETSKEPILLTIPSGE